MFQLLEMPSENRWWARQGLNLRPHPCEGCALPLSYAPAEGGGPLASVAQPVKQVRRGKFTKWVYASRFSAL